MANEVGSAKIPLSSKSQTPIRPTKRAGKFFRFVFGDFRENFGDFSGLIIILSLAIKRTLKWRHKLVSFLIASDRIKACNYIYLTKLYFLFNN